MTAKRLVREDLVRRDRPIEGKELEDLIVDLVNACTGPIEQTQLLRLVEWAVNTMADMSILRLLRQGRLQIVVTDAGLPPNEGDWSYRTAEPKGAGQQ